MKIVCTVTNDLSQDQRMDRICSSLVAAGHEVTLVGRALPTSQPLPERGYTQQRISCRYTRGKRFYGAFNTRLYKALDSGPFDAVCAVDADTLAAGAGLCRGGRRKLVFDAHEWFHMTPEVVDRPLVRTFWRQLVRSLVGRTDLRYTVGPVLARALSKDYGADFEVVRNVPRRVPGVAEGVTERKVILYQGMLNPGRGLEVAIRAMERLPDYELWIAGSGPEEGALRRCSVGLQEAGRVKFLGFVVPAELPGLTSKAWLGLNLLEASSPSYYLSLANKALDYVQAHLPSVQMDFPEYRALNEEFACYALLPELSPEALAKLIQRLATEPARYRALRENCKIAARALCWEREEEVLLKLWGQVE